MGERYTHTGIHTDIYPDNDTPPDTYTEDIHTDAYVDMRSPQHDSGYGYTLTHTHTPTHPHTHAHIHSGTHTHTPTHTYIHTDDNDHECTNKYTLTHTNKHICILKNKCVTDLSSRAFYCDLIDDQFVAVWYSTCVPFGHALSRTSFTWDVFNYKKNMKPQSMSDEETQLKSEHEINSLSNNSIIGNRVFRMLTKYDTWGVVDWKSAARLPDGSVVIFDFCPSSGSVTI